MTFSIIPTFGAGVPAAFKTSVRQAIGFFERTFTNNVTEHVKFDFAPLGGNAVAQSQTALAVGGYATIANQLFNQDATIPADQGLLLPRTDPFSGNFFLTIPEAHAIGFSISNALDATVTLNSNLRYTNSTTVPAGTFYAPGVLEHEVSETMGRICGASSPGSVLPAPEALFRYSSPNVIDTTNGINDTFSINGTTSIHSAMGEPGGGDLADWNTATGDCVGFAVAGRAQHFSAADVRVMEALGWSTGAASVTPLAPNSHDLSLSPLVAVGSHFSA